jgi:hypothetical protein
MSNSQTCQTDTDSSIKKQEIGRKLGPHLLFSTDYTLLRLDCGSSSLVAAHHGRVLHDYLLCLHDNPAGHSLVDDHCCTDHPGCTDFAGHNSLQVVGSRVGEGAEVGTGMTFRHVEGEAVLWRSLRTLGQGEPIQEVPLGPHRDLRDQVVGRN